MIGRKEFNAIAERLNDHSEIHGDSEIYINEGTFYICIDLAHLFAGWNPRFDHDKFMTACGYSAKTIKELGGYKYANDNPNNRR